MRFGCPRFHRKRCNTIIEKKDLEFNRYFYENLYFKLEPTHMYYETTPYKLDFIRLNNDKHLHPNNKFYKILQNDKTIYNMRELSYKIIKYYNDIFPNVFVDNKYKNEIYINTTIKSKINNYDDLIELKNILNISDDNFKKKILIGTALYSSYSKYLLYNICLMGNIELVFKIINTFWTDDLLKIDNIENIMALSSLSKNYELVSLLFNFYTFEKNIIFDESICSNILQKIMIFSIQNISECKKNFEFEKIIYEWLNMGGIIKGYTDYTNYIQSIKIKKNN